MMHFIGFRDNAQRFDNAVRVFGQPDFVHRIWDIRAKQEIVPGDVAIFAKETETDKPSVFSYDDSAHV